MKEEYREYLRQGQAAGSRYSLAMGRNVPRGTAGAQMGAREGSSIEFMDHREYQPGDDLRRVDWSAYARSDRLAVKRYREEVNPHVDVVLDGSRSMGLAGTGKARGLMGLAGVFAEAAANAGYRCCGWITRGGCERVVNGTERASVWEGIELESRESPGEALARMQGRFAARGTRVFLSDLLWVGEPLRTMQMLARGAANVVVVQVLARADVEAPSRGNIRLVDAESGEVREIFIDAAVQRRYRERLREHQENWHRACRQVGAVLRTVIAEEVVEGWVLDELVAAEIVKVKS